MISSMDFRGSKFRITWCVTLQSGSRFILRNRFFRYKDIRRTVQEIGVTVVVMEIRLSERALEKVECNLQTVGNGLRLTLLMKPIYMILLIYHGWYFQCYGKSQRFWI